MIAVEKDEIAKKTLTLICLFLFVRNCHQKYHPTKSNEKITVVLSSKLFEKICPQYHFQSHQESELQQWFRNHSRVETRSDQINDFQFCACDDSLFKNNKSIFFLRDVNVDKNKFQLDKNKSFMNVDEIVKYVVSNKKKSATSRTIDDKQFDYFIPKRRKSYFYYPYVNDVKSSQSLLLTNVSFISLRCRTFFYDEFSKKYEFSIEDICNKRLPERETKLFVQRIKTRIPVPITMASVILLRAYFLMFRQIKILIFNSWTTTDDICYPITMLICFVTEFDDWTFKIDRQYVSQQQICQKESGFRSCAYDHPLYQIH